MRRAQQRIAEDIRAALGEADEQHRSSDEERRHSVTQSGIIPRPPEREPLTRAGHVLRSLRVYEALVALTAKHVALGEEEQALRAIADACAALDEISDRRPYARVLIGIGECLLDLGYPEHAEPRLEETVALADALPDRRLGAAARRALGRARLELGNPSCRKILREASTMFADLGDDEAMVDIEHLLQRAAAAIMNLPRPIGVRAVK